MAISGTFTADFSSFQTAVQNADLRLKAFEGSSNKVETALSRMTNSFTGQKVITDATLMAEAIERIGGVSKLTEAELSRVSATAKEAAAKLTAMGQDVPPGIQKIADASVGATTAAFNWKNALLGVAGTLGVAFTVNAIKNFAINVIDTGAAIGDMAVKLGVSAEAIQRWKYAAEQSGATIEQVQSAVAFMNRTLAEGSKSTVASLAAAGLEFAAIRKMKPEDAFNTITDAIGGLEDPMIRAKLQMELLGRGSTELTAAMVEGFKKVGAETKVMSDDTVARLKAAQDAWGRLSNAVTIHSGEMIASVFKVTTSWKEFTASLATALVPGSFGRTMRTEIVEVLDSLTGASIDLTSTLATVPPVARAAAAGLKPVAISGAEVDTVISNMNTTVRNSAAALSLVEPKVGSLDKAIKGFTEHNEKMNLGLRFTSEVIGELPPKLEAMAQGLEKVADAQKAVTASKDAPGSVGINTGGIALGNFEAAFKMFNNIYGSNSGVGAAGPVAPDFLSWALRNGFATRTVDASAAPGMFQPSAAAGPAPTINMNGVLMGTDPAALQQIRDLVSEAVRQSMSGARV